MREWVDAGWQAIVTAMQLLEEQQERLKSKTGK